METWGSDLSSDIPAGPAVERFGSLYLVNPQFFQGRLRVLSSLYVESHWSRHIATYGYFWCYGEKAYQTTNLHVRHCSECSHPLIKWQWLQLTTNHENSGYFLICILRTRRLPYCSAPHEYRRCGGTGNDIMSHISSELCLSYPNLPYNWSIATPFTLGLEGDLSDKDAFVRA